MYYVYILKSVKDKKYYTGYTSDLAKRVAEHNEGLSKSTAHRRPFELVYYEASRNIKDAIHREKYLKSTYGHRYLKNRTINDINDAV